MPTCWVTINGMAVDRQGRRHVQYTAMVGGDPPTTWSGDVVNGRADDRDGFLAAVVKDAASYGVSLTETDIHFLQNSEAPIMAATYTLEDLGLHDDPDKSDDQTAVFQAGLDQIAATGGGVLAMEPWTVAVTKLRVKQGIRMVGSGMAPSNFGGTCLYRLAGSTDTLLANDPISLPGTEWWHWTGFESFRMEDDPSNTQGCGFECNCRTGEGFVFEKIFAYNFAEHNIAFRRGGTTLFPKRIHTMRARNGAGLLIERQGADTWSAVCADGVSGDNNKVALVRIMRAGAEFESFKLTNLKSESKDADAQPCVVELEGLNTAHVEIDNISASAVGVASNPQAVVRLAGAQDFCRLQVANIKADAKYTYLIQNMVTPANSVLNDGTTMRMGYRQFIRWKMGTDTSYLLMKL